MSFRSVLFSVIAASLLLSVSLRAADDDGKKAKHKGYVAMVLSKADDLKLTDDEKTKLNALLADDKPPDGADKDKIKEHNKEMHAKVAEILTKEQKDKLKELNKKAAATDKPADKTDAPKEEAKKDDAPKDAPKEEKKDDGNNMGN